MFIDKVQVLLPGRTFFYAPKNQKSLLRAGFLSGFFYTIAHIRFFVNRIIQVGFPLKNVDKQLNLLNKNIAIYVSV